MSNIESQAHRIVGPASLADILGTDDKHPTGKPCVSSSGDPFGYDRARVLVESAGGNIDPRFVGLGTNFTVRRRFV